MCMFSNFVSSVNMALKTKKVNVKIKKNKLIELVVKKLVLEGLLVGYNDMGFFLNVLLKYDEEGVPVINKLYQISSGSKRIYLKSNKLQKYKSNAILYFVTTSSGIITTKESFSYKLSLGGEIILAVSLLPVKPFIYK